VLLFFDLILGTAITWERVVVFIWSSVNEFGGTSLSSSDQELKLGYSELL